MCTLQEAIRVSADLKSGIKLLEILAEAEDYVKNGRVAPVSDTFDKLRAMLQEL